MVGCRVKPAAPALLKNNEFLKKETLFTKN